MKIGSCLVVALLVAACAKPAPEATPIARPPPGQVLFTVEIYDVPSRDELVTDSPQVLTAAKALNLRDHLDVVKAKLRSSPRMATLFGKPATVSQSGHDAPGFAFRADAIPDGERLSTRFAWFDLAEGARAPAATSTEGATSWTATIDPGGVVALRLPAATDGTPRLALVRVEAIQR